MAITYNAATILDNVRGLAGINTVQAQGNDDPTLLRYVNEALRSKIVPFLVRVRQEYLTFSQRITLSGSVSRYRIPGRAVGNRLRDVVKVDSGGTRDSSESLLIRREELANYSPTGSGDINGVYLDGNYIQCVPVSGSYTGFLEVTYYMRPSVLVASGAFGAVQSVNTATKQLTLTATPPSTFLTGVRLDVHSSNSGGEIKQLDLTQNGAVAGNVVTVTEAIDGSVYGTTTPEAGDFLCLANESAILQVPDDLVLATCQAAALRFAISERNQPLAQMLAQILREGLLDMEHIFRDRVESKTVRVRGWEGIRGWTA